MIKRKPCAEVEKVISATLEFDKASLSALICSSLMCENVTRKSYSHPGSVEGRDSMCVMLD